MSSVTPFDAVPSQPVATGKPVARLHIFRAGQHTSGNGITRTYSAAELAACAAAYDPARFAAPLVIGHPQNNTPAYGWVARLVAEGIDLFADVEAIDPLLADAIKVGMYRKISASLYLAESPANPVPGVLYLRHVGLLGGAAPAVKGLTPVTLAEADGVAEYTEAFEFCRNQSEQGETAMSVEYTGLTARLDALEAENANLKAAAKAAADTLSAHKRAATHAEHAAFAEALIKAGRLTPAAAPAMVATLDHLTESAVNFTEGDAGAPTPLAQALRNALAALPAVIPLGELAAEHGEAPGAAAVAFSAPPGFAVDASALDLHRKASSYALAHQVSYEAALALVVQKP